MFARIILISLIALISACAPSLDVLKKFQVRDDNKPISTEASDLPNPTQSKLDHRLRKILPSPSLLAAKDNIKAAKKSIDIVGSEAEAKLNATSNVGPRLSDSDTLEFEATAGLPTTK